MRKIKTIPFEPERVKHFETTFDRTNKRAYCKYFYDINGLEEGTKALIIDKFGLEGGYGFIRKLIEFKAVTDRKLVLRQKNSIEYTDRVQNRISEMKKLVAESFQYKDAVKAFKNRFEVVNEGWAENQRLDIKHRYGRVGDWKVDEEDCPGINALQDEELKLTEQIVELRAKRRQVRQDIFDKAQKYLVEFFSKPNDIFDETISGWMVNFFNEDTPGSDRFPSL